MYTTVVESKRSLSVRLEAVECGRVCRRDSENSVNSNLRVVQCEMLQEVIVVVLQ
jgi:hypothetical protein